ncbi:MAG: hypothetical protein PHI52_09690 [Bacteroidales bacterium]|nr:hypothetical protein [Bacteroidales bacterium]
MKNILYHKKNYFCIRKIQIPFTQKKIGYAIINDTINGEAVKRTEVFVKNNYTQLH